MQPEEKTIFRCKTADAYTIKMLFELLHNNIKTGCFELHKDGIQLCMTDSNRRTLIDVKILSREMNFYLLQPDHLRMGINVHHVYKMLRSVKKKDSMIMFINESNPSDLGIQIIPKDQTRLTTSFVRIQNIQNLEIEVPNAYDSSVLVSSCEFAKMCKDMLQMSQTIHIRSTRYNVRFTCNLGSVYSREVMLGETGFMNNNINIHEEQNIFDEDFDTEQLSRIIKIASLSSTMNVYCKQDYPLFIQTKIGMIGVISLYLKSKSQIEAESVNDRLHIVNIPGMNMNSTSMASSISSTIPSSSDREEETAMKIGTKGMIST